MEDNPMIELVLAFQDKDGKYAEHAGVVLASVFHNTSVPVNVHILHDETLTEDNKQRLLDLTTDYNGMIQFYHITLPEDMLQVMKGIASIGIWTEACMYRLLLPAIIPVDKMIYLDCDVLVNLDIEELWQSDLGNYELAAAKDQGIMGIPQIISSKGLNPDHYFNSGVIVFDLNRIRSHENWYEETLNFLQKHPDTAMPDQDALNAVFGGNYLPLDQRFNWFSATITDYDFNNKIVHFAGEDKCWKEDSSGWKLYQYYLDLTPWGKRQSGKTAENSVPKWMPAEAPRIEMHPVQVNPFQVNSFQLRLAPALPALALAPASAPALPAAAKRKIRKRKTKSMKRYRKRMYGTASKTTMRRTVKRVPQAKPVSKKRSRMKGRRTKTVLVSFDSLKWIRTGGGQGYYEHQGVEINPALFLPARTLN